MGLTLLQQSEWIFENGTSTKGLLGTWNSNQSVAYIQTANIGPQKFKTLIRGCSDKNELIEMYFNVNVLENKAPYFSSEIQRNWTVFVGDQFIY